MFHFCDRFVVFSRFYVTEEFMGRRRRDVTGRGGTEADSSHVSRPGVATVNFRDCRSEGPQWKWTERSLLRNALPSLHNNNHKSRSLKGHYDVRHLASRRWGGSAVGFRAGDARKTRRQMLGGPTLLTLLPPHTLNSVITWGKYSYVPLRVIREGDAATVKFHFARYTRTTQGNYLHGIL